MPKQDLTGRDEQMITKALSYAIEAIARLPDRQQEASDCADMMTVFKARVPDAAQRAHRLARARCHLTGEDFPTVYPVHDEDE